MKVLVGFVGSALCVVSTLLLVTFLWMWGAGWRIDEGNFLPFVRPIPLSVTMIVLMTIVTRSGHALPWLASGFVLSMFWASLWLPLLFEMSHANPPEKGDPILGAFCLMTLLMALIPFGIARRLTRPKTA